MSAETVPASHRGLTPYICCANAASAIEFYQRAFGAEEMMRLTEPSGRIGHAELKIAGAPLMLSDEYPDYGVRSPKAFGGTPMSLHLYVDNVDAVFAQAVAAGAKVLRGLEDQFYGDRSGTLLDPFGHRWTLATHKEEVAPEEMQRRWDAMLKK